MASTGSPRLGPGFEAPILSSSDGAQVDLGALLGALGDGVVAADAGGRIILANQAAGRLLGVAVGDLVGREVVSLVPAELRDAYQSGFERFVSTGRGRLGPGELLRVSTVRPDGTGADLDMALGALGAAGDPGLIVVASLREATDRVTLEDQLELSRYLRATIDVAERLRSADSVEVAYGGVLPTLCSGLDWDVASLWLVDGDGERLSCADVWRVSARPTDAFERDCREASFGPGEGLPGTCWKTEAPVGTTIHGPLALPRLEQLEASGMRSGLAFPLIDRDGVLGVVEMFRAAERPVEPQLLELLNSIGRQLGQFLSRIRVESALRAAERVEVFLLGGPSAMAAAADYADAFRRLAAVAVPEVADLCLIDVRGASGAVERMAAVHADPAKAQMAEELLRRYPPLAGSSHPSGEVMATGRSRWSPTMSDEYLAATTRDARHLQLVKALGFTSFMCVPLSADDEVLGAMTLVSAGSGRRFQAADLAMPRELAARVAGVMSAARRHDREHALAHQLQSILLPSRLPDPPGLEIAVRYMTGLTLAEVGGDFYDAVTLPSGRIGLMIGDVEGHDATAAALMGQLRSAARVLAGQVREPLELVEALRLSWDLLGFERTATGVFARVDPTTGEMVIASAGHLQPVHVDRAGHAAFVPVVPVPPLGAPPAAGEDHHLVLGAGETIFFYTDGLVERRGSSLVDELPVLLSVLEDSARAAPADLCDKVLVALDAAESRQDDVAIMAVRRDAAAGQGGPAPA